MKHYIDCMPAGANVLLPRCIVISRILTHHDNIFWFGCVCDFYKVSIHFWNATIYTYDIALSAAEFALAVSRNTIFIFNKRQTELSYV